MHGALISYNMLSKKIVDARIRSGIDHEKSFHHQHS